MKWTRGNLEKISGSFYVGQIDLSFLDIVRKLGPASAKSPDGKVKARWIIKFEDGTIASLYDWKSGTSIKDLSNWRIGGHSYLAMYYVYQIFEKEREAIKLLFENHEF